VWAEV